MRIPPRPHGAGRALYRALPAAAFTLIELLTVIAIIGILAAIVIPTVGMTIAARIPIIAMTVSSSMRVKADAAEDLFGARPPPVNRRKFRMW